MMRQTQSIVYAAVLLALAGCGSRDQISRVIVCGDVTFDGQPVKNGQINFYPLGETPGGVAGAPIVAGKYQVENKGGVPVGKHRVEVEGYRAPPPLADPDAGRVQFLPAKFNQQTELTVEISDSSDQNFHLKP
jgi:hypothetical protein